MKKNELKRKYAVLDMWIKKYVGEKAFLFVANAASGKQYCIARSRYGRNVQVSEYMTLDGLEMFLWGIIHAREVKAAARGVGRYHNTLYEQGATVAELVQEGKIIDDYEAICRNTLNMMEQ